MKKGDVVTWGSQAKGYQTVKKGPIVLVVPAGRSPKELLLASRDYAGYPFHNSTAPRAERSYIVLVGKTENSKGKIYWPKVRYLKLGGWESRKS